MADIHCQSHIEGTAGELRLVGRMGGIHLTHTITLHASLDRVHFQFRLEKPPTTNEQRLLHLLRAT